MIFLGLDPGVSGALAVQKGDLFVKAEVFPLPLMKRGKRNVVDGRGLVGLLRTIVGPTPTSGMREDVYATVEELHPAPAMMGGSIASFQRGYSAAIADLAFGGLGIEVNLVAPATWQKVMLGPDRRIADRPRDDTKTRSIREASVLFGKEILLEGRMNAYDHNIADALLLCEYGRRLFMADLKRRTG